MKYLYQGKFRLKINIYKILSMNRLGERIKRKREILSLPLSELSKKVGISASALSQIENSKAFPSIVTLKSIANSLYTTVGELIGENESLTKNPLIKAGDIKFVKVNSSGTTLFLLSHHENSKQMEPYIIKFIENSDSSDIMHTHPGQEFIYALEGKLIITLDNSQYILEKGDNFYFNSTITHALKNISNSSAKVLWVITPPNI
jgi:XRE family transcriptional regulator, regulator of sulfur utilization